MCWLFCLMKFFKTQKDRCWPERKGIVQYFNDYFILSTKSSFEKKEKRILRLLPAKSWLFPSILVNKNVHFNWTPREEREFKLLKRTLHLEVLLPWIGTCFFLNFGCLLLESKHPLTEKFWYLTTNWTLTNKNSGLQFWQHMGMTEQLYFWSYLTLPR